MKLQVPFLQLPLLFDAAALADEIAALGEDHWRPHPQGYPGNSMLPLVAVGGDPDNEAFAGRMAATPHLASCRYLTQVMSNLGVVLGRSRLMRLSGHAEVSLHVDQGYYWTERMRVHVPIVTQPSVRFDCGGAAVNMAAGECWIFDTWRPHRVINDAEASRIHLVVDTVGGDGFWALTSRGRPHDAPRGPGWQPRRIAPGEPTQELAFESSNVPAVMTPWELNSQLSMLFADVLPNPQLGVVHQMAGQLVRTWRSLWAQFGDGVEGRDRYREVMDRFIGEVRQPAESLVLRNDLRWYGAMVIALGKSAVVDLRIPAAADEYGMSDRA
ncbi:aspartyl/asparaginyl beta-hydroxylase domain-containing protein [Cognatiluteimonas profundi]|uniref:aspartyl/asparaginyl beta-hydroxylase domain-containing protein n=1 Tax=Cognatiluteimonas profundi TaxID=2594501 RepID=UPI00131A9544|nr:aspartyl/asparaginyl beta-hydroxylase domain-containing protein [Lysobacter profundi]